MHALLSVLPRRNCGTMQSGTYKNGMTEKLPGNAAVPRIGPPISCLPLLRSSLPPRLFASTKGSPMHKGGGNVKVPVNFLVPGTSTGASFNFGIFLENSGDDHSCRLSLRAKCCCGTFLNPKRALAQLCRRSRPQQMLSSLRPCVRCVPMRSFHSRLLVLFQEPGPLRSSRVSGNMAQQVQPFQLPAAAD